MSRFSNFNICLFIIGILFLGTASIFGCKGNKAKDDVKIVNREYFDFDSVIVADYELMKGKYGDGLRYFESQGKLSVPLYEATDANVVFVKNVFAVDDTVFIFTHDINVPDVKIEKINSYWLEDQVTTPYNEIKLKDAIDAVNKCDIIRPKSPVFVIRRPLYPPFPDHNFYIFGDMGHSPFIQVDSKTGEVKINEF